MWMVIFDLWTLCGVLCGVICECGGISRGVLCVGGSVWGIFAFGRVGGFSEAESCARIFLCVWGRVGEGVCECLWTFYAAYFVCGVILWCVGCVGSCVWGILPRVSYMVPGCGGKVFLSGPCVFFFSPTFFDIFPFDLLLNHVSTPILPLV